MRTIVYVDGYNLFYAVLTESPHKWLNLFELFNTHIVKEGAPGSDILIVKYFTSPALPSVAGDPEVGNRQNRYHQALRAHGQIEIIPGFHSPVTKKGMLTGPIDGTIHPDKVEVHLMEEKQTDVNIGLHMYRDAIRNKCDHIVLCSNDSDLEPALKMIKDDCPDIHIGVILPRKPDKEDKTRLSARLIKHADWKRRAITEVELSKSQFPNNLLDHKRRTIKKPDEWSIILDK